jgi:hypothetical protein
MAILVRERETRIDYDEMKTVQIKNKNIAALEPISPSVFATCVLV